MSLLLFSHSSFEPELPPLPLPPPILWEAIDYLFFEQMCLRNEEGGDVQSRAKRWVLGCVTEGVGRRYSRNLGPIQHSISV